ncbi:MAG: Uma2 family endonuclease, partial [Blastocatellia bacterium]|nr:Uma2 family endonuclease [Blastocatellia bacterium]
TADYLDYLEAIEQMPDGCMLTFEDVSWGDYESLLTELGDHSNVRLTYDGGRLEIMSPSRKHDFIKSLIAHLVGVLTEELDMKFVSIGSTTLRKEEEAKGTEPDDCFYINNVDLVIGQIISDQTPDPPPDLAIEVDISHRSDSKFSVYAALGVPEIWRYRKEKVHFYRLAGDRYVEISSSSIFPFLTPNVLAEILNQEYIQDFNSVKRTFRDWVRANKPR